MDSRQRRMILEYVRGKDPGGEIVRLEPGPEPQLGGGTIEFCSRIRLHRVERELTDEKWVEAFLVIRLVRELGYAPENLEMQKEYPTGRKKRKVVPRIDVLVRDERGSFSKTFMMIEVKDPDKYEEEKDEIRGQLFGLGDHERTAGLKYLVYYTVILDGDKLVDRAIVIDAQRFATYDEWDSAGQPSFDRLPREYGAARKSIYVNKSPEDLAPGEACLRTSVTRAEFDALRRDLHNVLWGGGGTPDNDVFSTLTKLFLAKIYDEQSTRPGDPYTFQIEFRNGVPESPDEVVEKLNSLERWGGRYVGLLRRAQQEYLGMSDDEVLASRGIDLERVTPGKVAYVVERLQGISLTRNDVVEDKDLLGWFFESIVRTGFKQSKGQFFTHANIARFCVWALKIDEVVRSTLEEEARLPYIIDPACGSGTFLFEAMKAITAWVKSQELVRFLPERTRVLVEHWFYGRQENIWARDFIYGVEISADLALATKVNMILHGDGSINVFAKDGLLAFPEYVQRGKYSILSYSREGDPTVYDRPVNEQFDVVLSNPPFSVDLDTDTRRGLRDRFLYADQPNSENLFIERWYQLLRPGGRMAVVLPEAVFDTAENAYIRLFLFKYFHLKAVVSLPELAFQPWTPTRTCLLFATKKTPEEVRRFEALWKNKESEFNALVGRPVVQQIRKGAELLRRAERLASSVDKTIHREESMIKTLDNARMVLATSVEEMDEVEEEGFVRCAEALEGWLSALGSLDVTEAVADLKELLKSLWDDAYCYVDVTELVDRYWEDVLRVVGSKWWVLTEVLEELGEEIRYYNVEQVGYKRTQNREREAPNELYSVGPNGLVDLSDVGTVLGKLRAEVNYL